jgi:hypothetical protein
VIPLAQAYDSTAVSLKKHLAYGAIFAVMAAGYGVKSFAKALPPRRLAAWACCAAVMIYPTVNGLEEAMSWYHSWPNQASLLSKLEPILTPHSSVAVAIGNGGYLCPYFYAGDGSQWQNCISTTISAIQAAKPSVVVISYPTSVIPPSSLPSSLVLSRSVGQLSFLEAISNAGGANSISNSELPRITEILETSNRYRLVATGPYDSDQSTAIYTIWERITSAGLKAPLS